MAQAHRQTLKRIARWALAPVLFIVVMAILFAWASHRRANDKKRIDQKLETLRAAGEPVDSKDLAKMFPPPPRELDAAELLKDALAFITAHPAPGNLPILTGGPELDHLQAIDAESMDRMQRHYESTTNIMNIMPILPSEARFGEDWSNGVWTAPVTVSFITLRTAVHMLSARAMYAAEAGDAEGATAMLEREFRFIGALPIDSTLVYHMIRQACLGITLRITERCLNKVPLSESQLERVLRSMPPPCTNHMVGTFRVEHCGAIWVFELYRAGKDPSPIFGTPSAPFWKRTWERFWPFRNEYNDHDYAEYLDYIPKMIAAYRQPPPIALRESKPLIASWGSNVTSKAARTIMPNWSKAIEVHYRIDTQMELTRVALAIERFRLRHGRLPHSLDELIPTELPHKPVDPFDNGDFKFKKKERGYVLYSIGPDGIDQGGAVRTNQYSQTNYDITVTVER